VIGLLATIVVFPFVGAAVSRLLARVQWFLAGAGAVGVLLFVLNILHVPFLLVYALILGVATYVLGTRRGEPRVRERTELVPTILIALAAAWLLATTAIVPLDDYDGRAFWLLKARALAHEQQVDGPFFQQKESASPRNQYPLLVPLDASLLMNIGRELDDRHVRWLYACFAIAFALEVRRRLGAWCGAALLCLPEILRAAGTASSDVALGAFAAAAFFVIANDAGHGGQSTEHRTARPEQESPLQLGFWLSCAVLTKNEGLPLSLLLLAMGAFVFRKRIAAAVPPYAVTLAALFLWRSRIGRSDDSPFARLIFDWRQHLDSLRGTLAAFTEQFIAFRNWGVLWIAVAIAIAFLIAKRNWRAVALTAGVIAPMILLEATLIAVTDFDLTQMDGLARRLLTHLLGPALYAIAVLVRTDHHHLCQAGGVDHSHRRSR